VLTMVEVVGIAAATIQIAAVAFRTSNHFAELFNDQKRLPLDLGDLPSSGSKPIGKNVTVVQEVVDESDSGVLRRKRKSLRLADD
jgi:hypothetical protein